jgi:geranylgeranyl diphosphate synthase type II
MTITAYPKPAAIATILDVKREAERMRRQIDDRLGEIIRCRTPTPKVLESAMRHSVLAPGKRLRPILALMAARNFGGNEEDVLDFGCAIELVHTASLVLDDLPSMDNAALRRQQPTLHLKFGEDVAILTAVGMLSLAFGVIARSTAIPTLLRIELVERLSQAVGFSGLVAGQIRDLRDPAETKTLDGVTSLNHQKTGVLFAAAVEGGAAIAGATEAEIESVRVFANAFGLAFQLQDDLLDATATLDMTGKDAGKDAGKDNFISLIGVEGTRKAVIEAVDGALAALTDGPLRQFSMRMFAQLAVGA